jgi:hypothetical protein
LSTFGQVICDHINFDTYEEVLLKIMSWLTLDFCNAEFSYPLI